MPKITSLEEDLAIIGIGNTDPMTEYFDQFNIYTLKQVVESVDNTDTTIEESEKSDARKAAWAKHLAAHAEKDKAHRAIVSAGKEKAVMDARGKHHTAPEKKTERVLTVPADPKAKQKEISDKFRTRAISRGTGAPHVKETPASVVHKKAEPKKPETKWQRVDPALHTKKPKEGVLKRLTNAARSKLGATKQSLASRVKRVFGRKTATEALERYNSRLEEGKGLRSALAAGSIFLGGTAVGGATKTPDRDKPASVERLGKEARAKLVQKAKAKHGK